MRAQVGVGVRRRLRNGLRPEAGSSAKSQGRRTGGGTIATLVAAEFCPSTAAPSGADATNLIFLWCSSRAGSATHARVRRGFTIIARRWNGSVIQRSFHETAEVFRTIHHRFLCQNPISARSLHVLLTRTRGRTTAMPSELLQARVDYKPQVLVSASWRLLFGSAQVCAYGINVLPNLFDLPLKIAGLCSRFFLLLRMRRKNVSESVRQMRSHACFRKRASCRKCVMRVETSYRCLCRCCGGFTLGPRFHVSTETCFSPSRTLRLVQE